MTTPQDPLLPPPAAAAAAPAPIAQNDGSAVYSPFVLRYIYDFWVLWVSNSYAWRCPTATVQLPLYRASMGTSHLDIGVGTGYYPASSLQSSSVTQSLTLVDLNPNSLDAAAARVRGQNADIRITKVVASALEPLPPPVAGQKFDSVSVFFLLHCLAGPPEEKTKVFDVVRRHVADDGVLVGTTVLGRERDMNWFGRKLMDKYNGQLRSFDNWEDGQNCFEQGLRRNFEDVETWVVGQVLLFRAKKPRARPVV